MSWFVIDSKMLPFKDGINIAQEKNAIANFLLIVYCS